MEPELVVVPVQLVVEQGQLWTRAGCGARAVVDQGWLWSQGWLCSQSWLWGHECMGSGIHVVHGLGIGSEGRAGCAWEQGWLCMASGMVVHGVRASM